MKSLHKSLRQGFTLAEMVIVILVMAILVSMSAPALFQFLKQRDVQEEENTQLEIKKALQAYLLDRNALPSEAAWFTELAGYTNLSSDEMELDVWKRPRALITHVDSTRRLQGTAINVSYVTLHSAGPNGRAEASTGIAVSGDAFAAPTDGSWWKNATTPSTPLQSFSAAAAAGDDIMSRFTDYPMKLEGYNLTVQRLDRTAQALESYAKSAYAERTSTCAGYARDPDTGLTGHAECDNGAPERTVYYPKALAVSDNNDTASYANTTLYVNNGGNDTARRTDMVTLMRLLGLPDDFCCSALTLGSDSQPKPFYYFSNPRPRTGSGCGTRPDANAMKLPARITTDNNDSAAINPTCG